MSKKIPDRNPQYLIENSQSDIMLLYQEILADLRYWKTQQWLITTYVAGIYIGLITLTDKVIKNHNNDMLPVSGFIFLSLVVIVMLVIIFGCYFLCQYTIDIWENRIRKEKIISDNDMLKKYLGTRGNRHDIIEFLVVFLFFTIGGGLITIFSLYGMVY